MPHSFARFVRPSTRSATSPGRLRPWGIGLALVAALGLSACPFSDKLKGEDTDQLAAVVNDSEISVHQVKAYLVRNPSLAALGDAAGQRALDALVEQEMAAQAARKLNLDKSPAVIQAMELAKREVLARAYQDELAAKADQPDSEAIRQYYDDHPELFSNRKLYTLAQTQVKGDASALAGLKDKVEQMGSFDALKQLLASQPVQTASQTGTHLAEDLPMDLLPKLVFLKDGQSLVLTQAAGLVVLTVVKAEPRPLSRNTATEAIKTVLVTTARRVKVKEGMDEVRRQSQVERKGAFAKGVAASAASSASAVDAASSAP
jgi:EpsD family peptidyl-prolyl cis-trans isomerase